MFRTFFGLALLAIVAAAAPRDVRAQSRVSVEPAVDAHIPIHTSSPALRASLDRIAGRSALWREAVDTLRGEGRFVFVLTPDQVAVADSLEDGDTEPFDSTVVAAAAPVPDEQARVQVVLVVVNLPLIQEVHRRKGSLPGEMDLDLDLILVHEVYGHAIPYLAAGTLSGRCADPTPGQRVAEACSIRRENAIRQELGLGQRQTYGLEGLALARTWR